jgi:hypothetical protein
LWADSQALLVSTACRSRALARLGWTRKKTSWVQPRGAQRHAQRGATGLRLSQSSAWSLSTKVEPTSPSPHSTLALLVGSGSLGPCLATEASIRP